MNFCPKCGNDVRGAKFCTKCGLSVLAAETEMSEQIRIESDIAKFDARMRDKDFLKDHDLYLEIYQEIERRYTVIINTLGGLDSPGCETLLQICDTHIILNKRLREKWDKYGYPQLKTVAYQRKAMIFEKKKMYYAAACVCVDAIQDNHLDDGTKGGMVGRMTRLIKKSGMSPNPAMMEIIEKTLE